MWDWFVLVVSAVLLAYWSIETRRLLVRSRKTGNKGGR